MKIGIIITGLPTSGKTTIARMLARALSFDLIDKDDFLENLYDLNDVNTWEDRKNLSRHSDTLFQSTAKDMGSAVLVSHWKPRVGGLDGGTSTGWLDNTYAAIIEVYCSCPSEAALDRFLARKRHPSHLDQQRDPTELANRFRRMEGGYPIGLGPVLKVRTDIEVNQKDVVGELRQMLRTGPVPP